jgi:hypothetical protein
MRAERRTDESGSAAIVRALEAFPGLGSEEIAVVHENPMKEVETDEDDDLRPEYDFSQMKGVGDKYVERYREGTNVVLLDPDIAVAFPDAKAVNDALRSLLTDRTPSASS